LQFLLLFFKTRVVIDGSLTVQKWGTNLFPVAPGIHHVAISFNYIFGEVGKNAVMVDVPAGQTVVVNYRSPFWVFMKGNIRVTLNQGQVGTAGITPSSAPAGLYSDPNMQGGQRWWDGNQWGPPSAPPAPVPTISQS
jgi:hypothetical protein